MNTMFDLPMRTHHAESLIQKLVAKNKKTEHTSDSSFGSSAILIFQDPSLSVPSSQRVWLCRRQIVKNYKLCGCSFRKSPKITYQDEWQGRITSPAAD
jgi:hypothetical protein